MIENRQIEHKRSDFLFLRVLFPFLNLSKLLCVELSLHMLDANSFEVFLRDLFVDVYSVLMQSTLYSWLNIKIRISTFITSFTGLDDFGIKFFIRSRRNASLASFA